MVEEEQAAQVAGPDALDAQHRAAIVLADAMMTRPVDLTDEDVRELHARFTPAELLELTLDVMKWNAQKSAVALGVDDEVAPGALTDLVFDADGNWVRP